MAIGCCDAPGGAAPAAAIPGAGAPAVAGTPAGEAAIARSLLGPTTTAMKPGELALSYIGTVSPAMQSQLVAAAGANGIPPFAAAALTLGFDSIPGVPPLTAVQRQAMVTALQAAGIGTDGTDPRAPMPSATARRRGIAVG